MKKDKKKILHVFKIETSGILQSITLFHKIVEQSHNRLVHILMDNIKHWRGEMAVFSSPAMLHNEEEKEAQNKG